MFKYLESLIFEILPQMLSFIQRFCPFLALTLKIVCLQYCVFFKDLEPTFELIEN